MSVTGKHRKPAHGRSRAGTVAQRGLLGAILVSCGFAVQHAAANVGAPSISTSSGTAPDILDALGVEPPVAAASRDLGRTPLTPSPISQSARLAPALLPMSPAPAPTAPARPLVVLRAEKYVGKAQGWAHECLAFVRTTFRLPANQSTAIGAWRTAKHKHRDDSTPPAGVPVYWSGGSSGAGHVAISLGGGQIITTDLPSTGHISVEPLSAIHAEWGLTYLGWTEDLEGIRIWWP